MARTKTDPPEQTSAREDQERVMRQARAAAANFAANVKSVRARTRAEAVDEIAANTAISAKERLKAIRELIEDEEPDPGFAAVFQGSWRSDTLRTPGGSEVWQARVNPEFSAELLKDADFMGLANKTEVVKAALALWHRHVAEERMARGVKEFYGDRPVPLPTGAVPLDPRELEDDPDDE